MGSGNPDFLFGRIIHTLMPIPAPRAIFRQLSNELVDGQSIHLKYLDPRVAAALHLTEEERKLRTAGGQLLFLNRLIWAAVQLANSGALERMGVVLTELPSAAGCYSMTTLWRSRQSC